MTVFAILLESFVNAVFLALRLIVCLGAVFSLFSDVADNRFVRFTNKLCKIVVLPGRLVCKFLRLSDLPVDLSYSLTVAALFIVNAALPKIAV